MLGTPLPPIPPAALADALALLKAVEDPKTTRDRLTQLDAATTAATTQLKVLEHVEVEMRKREAEANALKAAAEEREAELQRRAENIARKQSELDARAVKIEAEWKDRDLALRAREQGLAEREKAFADLRQKVTGVFGG